MRGRAPHRVELSESDHTVLWRVVHNGRSEQRVARRARILLAMADPAPAVEELSDHLEVSRKAIWSLCRRYEERGLDAIHDAARSGRPCVLSSLQRVQIEQLACCEPAGVGLAMTHWSTRSLAKVAAERGVVPKIAHSTVSLILRAADLQPHRYRYWKTPTLNEEFVERASKILNCYEHVGALRQQGELVISLDEMPNLQALERREPGKPVKPGIIERAEFEYIRHGTVNFLAALLVHDGMMRGWCLDRNDSAHLVAVLKELLAEFKSARKIHLIWDGGPSHTSRATRAVLASYGAWVQVMTTPAHASWLNQAELLLRGFGARYVKRHDSKSREHLISHLSEGWHEYNHLFAHPFRWSWTTRDMEQWVARHVS